MNKRRALLTVTTLILLCAIVGSAYASYATSVLYTKFNSLSWSDYTLDKSYTVVTIDIKNYLTFNVTGTWAKVAFTNHTGDTGTVVGINVVFSDDDETVKVYAIDGATEVLIGTGTYNHTSTTRIVLSGQKIYAYAHVGNKTSTKFVDGFSFSEPFAYLRVKGSDVDTASDGYVQVNVNTGGAGTQASVNEWIPIIITFAMLGICVGYLKKIGKI